MFKIDESKDSSRVQTRSHVFIGRRRTQAEAKKIGIEPRKRVGKKRLIRRRRFNWAWSPARASDNDNITADTSDRAE